MPSDVGDKFISFFRRRKPGASSSASGGSASATAAAAATVAATASARSESSPSSSSPSASSPLKDAVAKLFSIADPNATVMSIAFDNLADFVLPAKHHKHPRVLQARAQAIDIGNTIHAVILDYYIPAMARVCVVAQRYIPAALHPIVIGAAMCCLCPTLIVTWVMLQEAFRAANGKGMDRLMTSAYETYRKAFLKKRAEYGDAAAKAQEAERATAVLGRTAGNADSEAEDSKKDERENQAALLSAWGMAARHMKFLKVQFADDAVDFGESTGKHISKHLKSRLHSVFTHFVGMGFGVGVDNAPRFIDKAVVVTGNFVAFWLHRLIGIAHTALVGGEIIVRQALALYRGQQKQQERERAAAAAKFAQYGIERKDDKMTKEEAERRKQIDAALNDERNIRAFAYLVAFAGLYLQFAGVLSGGGGGGSNEATAASSPIFSSWAVVLFPMNVLIAPLMLFGWVGSIFNFVFQTCWWLSAKCFWMCVWILTFGKFG